LQFCAYQRDTGASGAVGLRDGEDDPYGSKQRFFRPRHGASAPPVETVGLLHSTSSYVGGGLSDRQQRGTMARAGSVSLQAYELGAPPGYVMKADPRDRGAVSAAEVRSSGEGRMALMERERLARHRDDLTDQIEELRRFKHVPAAAPAPAPAPVLSPLAHIADELDRLKARMTSSAMVSAPQPANRRGSGYSSPQAYPTAKPPVHNNAPTKLAAMVPRYPPVSNITPPASSFPAGGEPPVRPSTNDQYLYVHASAASVLPDGTLVIRANAVQQINSRHLPRSP
jgi:hypothetical protein